MQWQLFPEFSDAILAILTGVIFGFLLRKATLSRFNTMVGQLLMKDFTLIKVVLSLALTTAILVVLQDLVSIRPEPIVSSAPVWMSFIGGGLFGVGLAIVGYGPETAPAAIGEGQKEGITAIFGFVIGSMLYAYFYPFLRLPLTSCNGSASMQNMPIILPEILMIVLLAFMLFLVAFVSKKRAK